MEDGVCIAQGLLMRGVNGNSEGMCHRTPLHWVSYFERPKIAHVLLNHGAKPNMEDGYGKTPLHLLSQANTTPKTMVLVLHNYYWSMVWM
jgi:ankyrin repeat protein